MENNFDALKKLIDRLKTISFFERLFNWKIIRSQLLDAVADLQKMTSNIANLFEINAELKTTNSGLSKDLQVVTEKAITQEIEIAKCKESIQAQQSTITQNSADISGKDSTIKSQSQTVTQLESSEALLNQTIRQLTIDNTAKAEEIATMKENLRKTLESNNQLSIDNKGMQTTNANLQTVNKSLQEENTKLISTEDSRRQKHDNDTATLNAVVNKIEKDRKAEIDEMVNAEVARIKNLKETWAKHQHSVKLAIKNISNEHVIEYVDKVSFKGEPDNTLKICDEFVVFDAKSPATDDLTNFPTYLKEQAEKAKKYAKQDGVKKDVFFVVPSNTLEKLTQFVFNYPDHDVFIISMDSLVPVILSLKKIEAYEFAENLSPEERDNICRVIGKFAHLTKRRIQIDSYFAKRFLEIAYQSEADLPKDILDKVNDFEKVEKLNPPQEKRAKSISTKELDKDSRKLNSEVASKGILMDDLKIVAALDELQLYKKEDDASSEVDKNYFK